VLSRTAPAVAAPDRGGPAGAKGARAVTVRGTRGRFRGACVTEVGHKSRARGGAPGMAPPGPPLGRVSRAPRWRSYPGGAGTEGRHWRRRGAPGSVQGGGVAGVGHTGRAAGASGVAPPILGRLSRAPRWGSHPGGAQSDAAEGDGAHLRVYRGP